MGGNFFRTQTIKYFSQLLAPQAEQSSATGAADYVGLIPVTPSITAMKFLGRIGPDPHEGGKQSSSSSGCPDILELEGGDIAIIGLNITHEAAPFLPVGAGCAPEERVVRIPRATLLRAQQHIASLS